ncbi:MAG: hypothetical protein ACXWV4_09180 [Flavitalea sp.]
MVLKILRHIRYQQLNHGTDFEKGGFPNYRVYQPRQVPKADNNSFFTSIILLTLRDNYQKLPVSAQLLADSIFADALPSYQAFRNQKGRGTYNFWKTNPPQVFPDGGVLNIFDKSKALPDDMDCTSTALWALKAPDSTNKRIKLLMQSYTNQPGKKLLTTFPEISNIPAYSTWFGVKVPVEFDVVVMCNVISWTAQAGLNFTKADTATIGLLTKVIEEELYTNDPFMASPNYATVPVILYHYSRMMSKVNIPKLEALKPAMIREAEKCFENAESNLEKIMISTNLKRWGARPPGEIILDHSNYIDAIANDPFVFFIANMGLAYPTGWKNRLATSKAGRFDYYCPAYNLTLLLENILADEQGN